MWCDRMGSDGMGSDGTGWVVKCYLALFVKRKGNVALFLEEGKIWTYDMDGRMHSKTHEMNGCNAFVCRLCNIPKVNVLQRHYE